MRELKGGAGLNLAAPLEYERVVLTEAVFHFIEYTTALFNLSGHLQLQIVNANQCSGWHGAWSSPKLGCLHQSVH
jgi:hypothetical protein